MLLSLLSESRLAKGCAWTERCGGELLRGFPVHGPSLLTEGRIRLKHDPGGPDGCLPTRAFQHLELSFWLVCSSRLTSFYILKGAVLESIMSNPTSSALPKQYHDLVEAARSGRYEFRVWDAKSGSPLVWTGDPDTSGFHCRNANLGSLSPLAFVKALGDLGRDESWFGGPWVRDSIHDHVLARYTPQDLPNERKREPDEMSCWISTTRSFRWALWEIARRMALSPSMTVHLTTLDRYPYISKDGEVGTRDFALRIEPHRTIVINNEACMEREHVARQGDFALAFRKARDSHESLYYGRIFLSSVKRDYIWTVDVSIFAHEQGSADS